MIIALFENSLRLCRKNIRQLFNEKVNVRAKVQNYKLYVAMYILSSVLMFLCIKGMFLEEQEQQMAISGRMIFLTLNIICFYFVLYESILIIKNKCLSKKASKIFMYNILTKDMVKNIWVSIVLSICLVFSFIAYISGSVFWGEDIIFISGKIKIYFAIVQICISVIILVVYYIVLAMDIVSELNLFKMDINILFTIGYNEREINKILRNTIIQKCCFRL